MLRTIPDTAAEAEQAFEQRWNEPAYTRVELPPLDVNAILDAHYTLSPARRIHGADLWELETRKARDPRTYIPTPVRKAETFGHRTLADGNEAFVRVSEQRRWLAPDQSETVIERTYLNRAARLVTFIGVAEAQRDDGAQVRAGGHQPLFSVQHGVGGTETQPTNLWRIVFETGAPDPRIVERFAQLAAAKRLPEYVTIFLARDLGVQVRANDP